MFQVKSPLLSCPLLRIRSVGLILISKVAYFPTTPLTSFKHHFYCYLFVNQYNMIQLDGVPAKSKDRCHRAIITNIFVQSTQLTKIDLRYLFL